MTVRYGITGIALIILSIFSCLFLSYIDAKAQEPSTIEIRKNAEPADGTDFYFVTSIMDFYLDDAEPDDNDAVGDRKVFSGLETGDYTFVERQLLGWSLDSIQCNKPGETIITPILENDIMIGVSITPDIDGASIVCIFNNLKEPDNEVIGEAKPVPTLNELGLVALSALLIIFAVHRIRMRKLS